MIDNKADEINNIIKDLSEMSDKDINETIDKILGTIKEKNVKRIIFLKSWCWRLIAIISSFALSFVFYKYFFKSIMFTIVLNGVNHFLYLSFEFIWRKYVSKD